MIRRPPLAIIAVALAFLAAMPAALATPKKWTGGDRYGSFTELTRHEREGVDYTRRVTDRGSPVTVLAIHGGLIEPGVSAIADRLTRHRFNVYEFRGIKEGVSNFPLHVTSTHFNDPLAMDLVRRHPIAVSIHSYWDEDGPDGQPLRMGSPHLCIGGLNTGLQTRAMAALLPVLPQGSIIEVRCRKFPGESRRNIVNLAPLGGLQLEFSIELIDLLLADPAAFEAVVGTLEDLLISVGRDAAGCSGPLKRGP